MRYKTKDIGDAGLDISHTVTAGWLAAECPDVDVRPAEGGLTLTARLERTGDSYLLRGDLQGSLIMPCGRCLEPAVIPLDLPITVSYVETDADDAEDVEAEAEGGEVLAFSGGLIDLGPEIRDEILLALPIGPVCRPDCAGICPVCGGNRNTTPCDCEELQRRAASKLSALKNIKI